MPINSYELERRGIAAAVAGGALLAETIYEGTVSFVQSMTSIDQALSRLHGDVACLSGLLFFATVGVILHVNSRSNRLIGNQPAQDYPNVSA